MTVDPRSAATARSGAASLTTLDGAPATAVLRSERNHLTSGAAMAVLALIIGTSAWQDRADLPSVILLSVLALGLAGSSIRVLTRRAVAGGVSLTSEQLVHQVGGERLVVRWNDIESLEVADDVIAFRLRSGRRGASDDHVSMKVGDGLPLDSAALGQVIGHYLSERGAREELGTEASLETIDALAVLTPEQLLGADPTKRRHPGPRGTGWGWVWVFAAAVGAVLIGFSDHQVTGNLLDPHVSRIFGGVFVGFAIVTLSWNLLTRHPPTEGAASLTTVDNAPATAILGDERNYMTTGFIFVLITAVLGASAWHLRSSHVIWATVVAAVAVWIAWSAIVVITRRAVAGGVWLTWDKIVYRSGRRRMDVRWDDIESLGTSTLRIRLRLRKSQAVQGVGGNKPDILLTDVPLDEEQMARVLDYYLSNRGARAELGRQSSLATIESLTVSGRPND